MAQEKKPLKNRKLVQFLLMFCVIMGMYFMVEVLPLNIGSNRTSWKEIPSQMQKRLPVVLAIALAASAYLVTIKQKKPGGKK
jgi:heme/copper-type cytochrome/quinol oxidase subunit 3